MAVVNSKRLPIPQIIFVTALALCCIRSYADLAAAQAVNSDRDYVKAFNEYKSMAEAGNAEAQFNLGMFYGVGLGVGQDSGQAVFWYQKAADQGFVHAQNDLGVAYNAGEGIRRDYKEAVKWFKKAAEQDDMFAEYNLGRMYYKGRGVRKDHAEAMHWYRQAADKGLSVAQLSLGGAYEAGDGISRDYAQAIVWYQKAADQGFLSAQFHLGQLYWEGKGSQKDFSKAYFWLSLAMNAKGWLELQIGSVNMGHAEYMIKKTSKTLSAEQIAQAQEQVKHWYSTEGIMDKRKLEEQLYYLSNGISYAMHVSLDKLNRPWERLPDGTYRLKAYGAGLEN